MRYRIANGHGRITSVTATGEKTIVNYADGFQEIHLYKKKEVGIGERTGARRENNSNKSNRGRGQRRTRHGSGVARHGEEGTV